MELDDYADSDTLQRSRDDGHVGPVLCGDVTQPGVSLRILSTRALFPRDDTTVKWTRRKDKVIFNSQYGQICSRPQF